MMLNTAKMHSFFELPETQYYSSDDVAAMRHVYYIACQERPLAAWTEAQRLTLAKAIVAVYEPKLSEEALLEAAFQKIALESWN
jgi:hypothetical protein